MKALVIIAIAVVAVIGLSVMPLTSCVSTQAQQEALLAPARLAWPAIEADVVTGTHDGESAQELTSVAGKSYRRQATEFGLLLIPGSTRPRLLLWGYLRPWAERGIKVNLANGVIGDGGVSSAMENLKQFELVLKRLEPTQ